MKMTKSDVDWGKAVKERDDYTCRRVFAAENHAPETARRGLHAHHIFGRGIKATRLDIGNGVTLCNGCHRWAHAYRDEFHEWIKGELGEDVYDTLAARARGRRDRVA